MQVKGRAVETSSRSVAEVIEPLVEELVGGPLPIALRFWDGSRLGPPSPPATLAVRSPDALRRLTWAPNELGYARAFVTGDIDIEGSVFSALELRDVMTSPDQHLDLGFGGRRWSRLLRAARELGVLGLPPPAPREEARLRGRRHTRERDARAVARHYDVSNDFYRLILGDTMTYSCAYFREPAMALDEAQRAKHDLICAKLGLREGDRLLDVGCGWGEMVIHTARRHGVSAVGVTVSAAQAELAEKRVAEAGVAGQVEIRLQDYRDVADGPFDAISSVGMFEHVGLSELERYFALLAGLLRPGGRLLNHAISRVDPRQGSFDRNSFIARYVFPDGELHEVGRVVTAMQGHGLEVRDVESLRDHYPLTLRRWVENLENNWERAVAYAGPTQARIWRLYMAASALGFEANRISVHQVLAVKPDSKGAGGMPLTRQALLGIAS